MNIGTILEGVAQAAHIRSNRKDDPNEKPLLLICPEFHLPTGEEVVIEGRKKMQKRDAALCEVSPRGECDFLLVQGPPKLLGE